MITNFNNLHTRLMPGVLCLFVLICTFLPRSAYSQDFIERIIAKGGWRESPDISKHVEKSFEIDSYLPFRIDTINNDLKANTGYISLEIDKKVVKKILDDKDGVIEMGVPVSGSAGFYVVMVEESILSETFEVSTSDGLYALPQFKFYRGYIKGESKSMVAMSIANDKMSMLISNEDGNYNLHTKDKRAYKLYNEAKHKVNRTRTCFTPDNMDLHEGSESEKVGVEKTGDAKCIPIYLETDYETYSNGFDSNLDELAEYLTATFNSVAVLYKNDSIDISLAKIHVSTLVEDDWSKDVTSINYLLDGFGKTRKDDFVGQLAHFTTMRDFGGGLAWGDVLCKGHSTTMSDWDGDGVKEEHHYGPYGVTSLMSGTTTALPNYSWDVLAIAHELGHNIGAYHTHACAWGPNNLAIDNCQPTEGGCGLIDSPTPESELGTIMSYCHFSSGIDLMKGFGTRPGNYLKQKIAHAQCSVSCAHIAGCTSSEYYEYNPKATLDDGSCRTYCGDGERNGPETGIDCGGDRCEPCLSLCQENYLKFVLKFDNYPTETKFNLKDSSGATIYMTNGDHSAYKNGDSVIYELCLPDGLYTLNVHDDYGDGICCQQGGGYFTLTDKDGVSRASGSDFGSHYSIDVELKQSSPCADQVMIDADVDIGAFLAKNKVSTDGDVMIKGNVVFNAPDINLMPGFQVGHNAVFEALSDGCDK